MQLVHKIAKANSIMYPGYKDLKFNQPEGCIQQSLPTRCNPIMYNVIIMSNTFWICTRMYIDSSYNGYNYHFIAKRYKISVITSNL